MSKIKRYMEIARRIEECKALQEPFTDEELAELQEAMKEVKFEPLEFKEYKQPTAEDMQRMNTPYTL